MRDGGYATNIEATVAGYLNAASFLGLHARLKFRAYLNEDGYYWSAADVLRGVLNDEVNAQRMVSLNLDVPVRVFRFAPSQWFHPESRLGRGIIRFFKYFEGELHLSPFVDLAMAAMDDDLHPDYGRAFSTRDLLAAGGIEFIYFSYYWRSLYLRISPGFNLREFAKKPTWRWNELFIGMAHHY